MANKNTSNLSILKNKLDGPLREHKRLLQIKINDIERLYGVTQSQYPVLFQKIFDTTPFPSSPAYAEWVAGIPRTPFEQEVPLTPSSRPSQATPPPPRKVTMADVDRAEERRMLRASLTGRRLAYGNALQPATEKIIEQAMDLMDQAMSLDKLVVCQTCQLCDSLLSIDESDDETDMEN